MTLVLGIAKVVYVLACILIIGSVLLQESKGGGLAGLGGTRAEAAFGASNPLRRLTVVLSVIFFVLAALLTLVARPTTVGEGREREPSRAAPGEPGKSSPSPGTGEAGEKDEGKAPETGGETGNETEGGTEKPSPETGGGNP